MVNRRDDQSQTAGGPPSCPSGPLAPAAVPHLGDLRTSAPGAYLPAASASRTCAYRQAARAARRPYPMDKPSPQTSEAITPVPADLQSARDSDSRYSSFPQGTATSRREAAMAADAGLVRGLPTTPAIISSPDCLPCPPCPAQRPRRPRAVSSSLACPLPPSARRPGLTGSTRSSTTAIG
jgi:hypothetical protein